MCIQLACSRRPRALEESHCWNIQAKFYNEKFPLVYENEKQETLYHEDHGATLKHKCGKRIVTLPLLSFSLIFPFPFSFSSFFFSFFHFFLSFWWAYLASFFIWASLASFIFHKVRSLIPTCGGIIVSIILSSLGQCSNNDDHHTFIYLQLNITTRYLKQRYDSI